MSITLSPEIISIDSLTERCDRCGAAAKLQVVLTAGGELAFCGHHAKKYAHGLAPVATKILVEDGFDWAGPASAE